MALNTASSSPPTKLLKPSLSTSMIDKIHPIIGTSLKFSDVFPIASFIPLDAWIIPLYAPLKLPEDNLDSPWTTLSIFFLRFVAVSDKLWLFCVTTLVCSCTWFDASSAFLFAVFRVSLAASCSAWLPFFSACSLTSFSIATASSALASLSARSESWYIWTSCPSFLKLFPPGSPKILSIFSIELKNAVWASTFVFVNSLVCV